MLMANHSFKAPWGFLNPDASAGEDKGKRLRSATIPAAAGSQHRFTQPKSSTTLMIAFE
jgi:hypothetical protein